MNAVDLTGKRRSIERWVKLGIVGLVGLLVAPIILLTIKGLIGLVVAGMIAVTGIQLAPVFAFKVANWRMKLVAAEANRNPIETMRNIYLDQSKIIQEKDKRIVEFDARVSDYHDRMVPFAKRYPEEAPRFQAIEDKMRVALASMKRKQTTAKGAQNEYKLQIDKASAIYDMALAAQEVTQLSADAEAQVFTDIKQQVSFDAVNHKFNAAVAALSLEVDNEAALELPALTRKEESS